MKFHGARALVVLAVEGLARRRLHSALSALGIAIGVAALVAMNGINRGARDVTLAHIQLLGTRNVVLRQAVDAGQAERLTWAVAQPYGAGVSVVRRSLLVQQLVRVEGPRATRDVVMLGVEAAYGRIMDLRLQRGRLLDEGDRHARVTALGDTLALQLFGYEDPIDRRIRLGDDWFTVVGVIGARALPFPTTVTRDLNDAVLVPLTTVLGRAPTSDEPIDEMWIEAVDDAAAASIAESAREAPARTRYIVVAPRELLAQQAQVRRTFAILAIAIAALCLLVGGIGMMNILLASTVERTAEIGLRRTVGATRQDIGGQFPPEAASLSGARGLVGTGIGVTVTAGIARYAEWPVSLSLTGLATTVAIAVALGLAFGVYPASRAARLEPIDAVRHE